ncbi:hypothetical protein CPB85DRAFT_1312363 [Mucidula mucida]|nr:hypothetical protein CPB85DRAFT_1312363 [Mucidula mucida]
MLFRGPFLRRARLLRYWVGDDLVISMPSVWSLNNCNRARSSGSFSSTYNGTRRLSSLCSGLCCQGDNWRELWTSLKRSPVSFPLGVGERHLSSPSGAGSCRKGRALCAAFVLPSTIAWWSYTTSSLRGLSYYCSSSGGKQRHRRRNLWSAAKIYLVPFQPLHMGGLYRIVCSSFSLSHDKLPFPLHDLVFIHFIGCLPLPEVDGCLNPRIPLPIIPGREIGVEDQTHTKGGCGNGVLRLHLEGWKRQSGIRTTSHSDRALRGRRSAVVLFFPEKEIHSRERGLPAKNCGEMEKIRRAVRERGLATRME